MPILYNCHTDGDHYRITKFNDSEVESSYLCTEDECECPAGHRHTCRHRQMLPRFLHRNAVNTFWFHDFDRNGWISNEPVETRTIATYIELSAETDVAEEFSKLLSSAPAGPSTLPKPWRRL